jgi:OFA family oxalate/formate antiporter-like MFS transporter
VPERADREDSLRRVRCESERDKETDVTENATRRGWIVALAGFGINLTLGVLYSWSIFSKSLVTDWGWSTGSASLPYAVAVALFATVLTFGGRAQDRYGPRLVATLGGALVGLGLLVSSLASPERSLPLVFGFGVLTGSGIALAFVATFPAAAKWFPPTRRGLVTGLVVSGFGIAAVYIAPLTQYLLGRVGITATFAWLGAAFFVVTIGLAQFVRNPPPGFVPPGSTAVSASEPVPGARRHVVEDRDWHEMIRTRQFPLLWLMYGLTAFAGLMVIGHMAEITLAQTGFNLGFLLVAVLAIGNASGRIVTGIVSDRIGIERTMTVVFSLQTVMMLVAGFTSTALLLAVVAFVIGFNYGADLALFPVVVTEYYGQANQGVNYGLVFTSWGVGGVFGSLTAAAIADATGSYRLAFLLGAGLCAIAALLSLVIKAPEESPASSTTQRPSSFAASR